MTWKTWMAIALLTGVTGLSACGPLVGAGAVVAADKIAEEENGDEGLF